MNRFLKPVAFAALAAIATCNTTPSMAQQADATSPMAMAAANGSRAIGLIVKYREGRHTPAAAAAAAQGIAAAAHARGMAVTHERDSALGARVMRFERAVDAAQVEQLARDMHAADANIEYIEPDYIAQPHMTPNDTGWAQQWHYFEATGGINLPGALDLADGSGVTVAVVDTGIRMHADIAANVLAGYDFITSSSTANDGGGRDSNASDPGDWTTAGMCANGQVRNSSWHGTHVAGTIAALTNNGATVAGVAGKAKILPVRVLGQCGGANSDIADGVIWAAGGAVSGVPTNWNKAKVINMSLGGQQACSATMQNAINAARNLGAMIVVSAGNSNLNASGFEPASCSGVITVAATNRNGAKAAYSNFGGNVFIAAPGGDFSVDPGVLSLSNTGTTTPGVDTTRWMQGTSMAAPHVSGVAALMLSANDLLPMSSLASILQTTARAFPGNCSQCGAGIVDATKAVQGAIAFVPEHEPNNTTSTQQLITVNPADIYGAINDGDADNDHYLVPLPAGQTLTAVLDNRGTIDMNLYYYNSNTGQVLGGSANAGGGGDEKISYVNTSGKQMWITLRVLRGPLAPKAATAQKYKLSVKKS